MKNVYALLAARIVSHYRMMPGAKNMTTREAVLLESKLVKALRADANNQERRMWFFTPEKIDVLCTGKNHIDWWKIELVFKKTCEVMRGEDK